MAEEWRFSPKPVHRLEIFTLLSYGLAAFALGVLPIPWKFKLGLLSILGISYIYGVCTRTSPCFPGALKTVRWDGQDRWWLHLASGEVRAARLLPSTYVSNWLILLRLRAGLRGYSVPLLPTSHNGEALRRLRVRLRGSAHSSEN